MHKTPPRTIIPYSLSTMNCNLSGIKTKKVRFYTCRIEWLWCNYTVL